MSTVIVQPAGKGQRQNAVLLGFDFAQVLRGVLDTGGAVEAAVAPWYRTFVMPPENMTHTLPPEDTTYVVPPEDTGFKV